MKYQIPFFVLFFIIISQTSFSQSKGKNENKVTESVTEPLKVDLYELNKTKYQNSLQLNDLTVATDAVYTILALRPNEESWQDTLTLLYFNRGAYVQTVLSGQQILSKNPEKFEILELIAISHHALGNHKEALAEYEKLYTQSKSIFHLYQIATLQYALQRYGEGNSTLDRILADPKSSEEKITISSSHDASQEVPIKAAALNMKGVIALDLNQKDIAKQYFDSSLQASPGFVLAENNLKSLTTASKK